MTAIYLAGRYGRREELLGYAHQLQAMGHHITSRWLQGLHEGTVPDDGHTPLAHQEQERFAQEDMTDLVAAEVVICWTEPPQSAYSRGGRHVELGMAIAWRKRIMLVGPRENVFCSLPMIEHHDTFDTVLSVVRWLPTQCHRLPHDIPSAPAEAPALTAKRPAPPPLGQTHCLCGHVFVGHRPETDAQGVVTMRCCYPGCPCGTGEGAQECPEKAPALPGIELMPPGEGVDTPEINTEATSGLKNDFLVRGWFSEEPDIEPCREEEMSAERLRWQGMALVPYTGPVDATWIGSGRSVALGPREAQG